MQSAIKYYFERKRCINLTDFALVQPSKPNLKSALCLTLTLTCRTTGHRLSIASVFFNAAVLRPQRPYRNCYYHGSPGHLLIHTAPELSVSVLRGPAFIDPLLCCSLAYTTVLNDPCPLTITSTLVNTVHLFHYA